MDTTGQLSTPPIPPGATKDTTISICMIVRNEEENLRRCLPSLRGLYDELIVVDTSVDTDKKDGTVELVKSFGAKVFHHPWENDFSKHRNQSIGYATKDWIAIIDADEEVVYEGSSPELVKKWLANELEESCTSAAITLRDIQQGMEVMRFHSVRFFRRGLVQYERAIHNQPKIIKGSAEAVFCPLFTLKHYGYDLSPEKALEKRKRTETLLLENIRQNPDDVAPYFYLVQAYTSYGEYTKAAEYIIAYEQCAERTGMAFNDSIFCTAASVYRKLGDKDKVHKWLLLGLKKFPRDLDLLLELTEFGVWTKDLNLVLKGAEGFLEVYDEYQRKPLLSGNRFTYANRKEALAYTLFHYSLGLLQKSSTAMDQLKAVLGQIGGPFEIGMTNDVQIVLDRFGWKRDSWGLIKNIEQQPRKVVNLGRR